MLNESTPQVRVTDADAVCMHIMSINGIIELRKYGVATSSRRFKIIGLFCRISSLLQGSFVKETYNFKEPTNRSHPLGVDQSKRCTVCSTDIENLTSNLSMAV